MKFTDDSGAFDNTIVDLATQRPRRLGAGTVAPEPALTVNELTTLGLLALNAADAASSEAIARRYTALAAKCDRIAEELVKP